MRASLIAVRIGLAVVLGFSFMASACAGDIFINPKYPIRGKEGVALSRPHVELTSECSTHVYVDSFVPKATLKIFLNGTTLIGGPVAPKVGYYAVPLSQVLHTGDAITATQTVNGVTSAPSAQMIVGAMPASLLAPDVGSAIYACGRVAPVNGLVSGVTVEVQDESTGTTIGNGFTPNDWGGDWAPVVTSALLDGHQLRARQSACTGAASPLSGSRTVNADPAPVIAPTLDEPIVGNDSITAHDLLTGSELKAFDHATGIGSGLTTASTNSMSVFPDLASTSSITAQQSLCNASALSPPSTPVARLSPPILVAPVCPGQTAVIVRKSTINATLVLLKNGVPIGYGGATPGDAPLDLAAFATLANNDNLQVAEYIGSVSALSNPVKVECRDVATYHNDAQRTGWNSSENTLTPANVNANSFGPIATARLDDDNDQIDAQPLIVTGQKIDGEGVHTVAYVVTENNAVYAFDGFSGAKLKKKTLGAPVPRPLNCENNGPAVGINSTPTIDVRSQTLYVVTYRMEGMSPIHELHALDLATLADKSGSPVKIAPSNTLDNGSTTNFDSSVQRQRPALLQANGNVYIGFGSFCDFRALHSRGWVVGYKQASLAPLAKNELTDKATTASNFDCYFHSPWTNNHPCFLSAIWMSGFGLAADASGDLFFTTGNTSPGICNTATNLAESVVKLSGDLSGVIDFFTPADENSLDAGDTDFGSGGTLVLPDQPGPAPHLAVAAGKEGNLFIVNRDTGHMGKFNNPNLSASVPVGACWCGPCYFEGADGVGRIVSSGGFQVMQWTVKSAQTPALVMEAAATAFPTSGQDDGGFFTSISSNGKTANTAIIWAVDRPIGADNHVTLHAFDATPHAGALKELYSHPAGTWLNVGGDTDLVPTIANGLVYVPSCKQVQIFGLLPPKESLKRFQLAAALVPAPANMAQFMLSTGPLFWGRIRKVEGSTLTLELRNGRKLSVDVSKVAPHAASDIGAIGRSLAVSGSVNPDGVLVATDILRAKGEALWGADRDQ
jgi:hypothetical protein